MLAGDALLRRVACTLSGASVLSGLNPAVLLVFLVTLVVTFKLLEILNN